MADELEPGATGAAERSRRERARTLAATGLGALAAIFAIVNLDTVKVDLLVKSVKMPLVVVIAACLLIGIALGALGTHLAGRRERD